MKHRQVVIEASPTTDRHHRAASRPALAKSHKSGSSDSPRPSKSDAPGQRRKPRRGQQQIHRQRAAIPGTYSRSQRRRAESGAGRRRRIPGSIT